MRRTLLHASIALRLATDVTTADRRLNLTGHSGWVYAVAVFPDGRSVLTGSGDRTAIIWGPSRAAPGSSLQRSPQTCETGSEHAFWRELNEKCGEKCGQMDLVKITSVLQ